MFNVFMIADEAEQIVKLSSGLVRNGFTCSIVSNSDKVADQLAEQAPDLVLIAMDESSSTSDLWSLPLRISQEEHLPVIVLIPEGAIGSLESITTIDDFVVNPWDVAEVVARIKRVLWRTDDINSEELIKCGDLVIDSGKCEVSIGGRLVVLTFKEYELLRFMASDRGRVFTRDVLLSKVWGYDYYGGDRTVDVHIRRLRSKIEDANHTFIETVRNIGYRFRKEV